MVASGGTRTTMMAGCSLAGWAGRLAAANSSSPPAQASRLSVQYFFMMSPLQQHTLAGGPWPPYR
jgi:hypothetical protein